MNVIAHADEIFLKGNNQPFFYNLLLKNLKSLFKGIKAKRVESGIWLEGVDEKDLPRLALVPGIANFAPALIVGSALEEVEKGIDELIAPNMKKKKAKFRISAERSFKNYPLTSMELEKKLGARVAQKTGWKVDLKNWDFNVNVSVGKDRAFVFSEPTRGAGGLPVGGSGKVLCLLSGGIDSPVAAYAMMRRGAEVALVHFQNQTNVAEEVGRKIFDIAKTLSGCQSRVRLFMVPFADLQKQIVMKVPAKYRMIINRRVFIRIAAELAAKHGFSALVLGDSLGQVASQTLENLACAYDASPLPVLSPLIGVNKSEITELARKIGTFEISCRPYEDCCSLFVARHPVTKCALAEARELEAKVDVGALDRSAVMSYYIGI